MKALRKYWNEQNKKVKKNYNKQKKIKVKKNSENMNNIKEEINIQNSKNDNENSIINAEEFNQITKEFEEIDINGKNTDDSNETQSNQEENRETKNKDNFDEVKQDFLNNKEAKDFLNERGMINNNKYDFYATINGQLNNPNNPFI